MWSNSQSLLGRNIVGTFSCLGIFHSAHCSLLRISFSSILPKIAISVVSNTEHAKSWTPWGLTAPPDPQLEGSDASRRRKRRYAASNKQLRSCVQGPRFYLWHRPQNHATDVTQSIRDNNFACSNLEGVFQRHHHCPNVTSNTREIIEISMTINLIFK